MLVRLSCTTQFWAFRRYLCCWRCEWVLTERKISGELSNFFSVETERRQRRIGCSAEVHFTCSKCNRSCVWYLTGILFVDRRKVTIYTDWFVQLNRFYVRWQGIKILILGEVKAGLPDIKIPPFSTVVGNQTLGYGEILSHLGTGVISIPLVGFGNENFWKVSLTRYFHR